MKHPMSKPLRVGRPEAVGAGPGRAVASPRLWLALVLAYVLMAVVGSWRYGTPGDSAAESVSQEPPIPVFEADHPFVFLIRDVTSGAILFMGRVSDPPALSSSP